MSDQTSADRPIRIPGPDHPITITADPSHVRVIVAGKTIADTRNALTLQEASYPPVHYIPRADLDMALVERTSHSSHCPYKGEASYFSIPAGGERSVNAIWSYETPNDAVAQIRDHVAFYPDRVDEIVIEP
ncbi:DUF427 domain-containing protein [Sphingomonas sp. So64.6b]|uniref:DUF427 domain-containing protein n=1 Tax=Sphingomonas sp. So64.6b TaxID=2997354 RepID=UPI0016013B78|nr:DUF427 domain-containing protein [Sphingomonas sp. So64.6b]QNA85259.1 DUF427 domain-containing protein [Sphingomonas sp. So64.6b]